MVVLFNQEHVGGMSSQAQMHREYVANGSRYQVKICWKGSETDQPTSVDIDVGDAYPLPPSAKELDISQNLEDGKQRQRLENFAVNNGKTSLRSTIITEEGTITHGYKNGDRDDSDWMWKSSLDETDHKPRKYFVANASGKEITVQPLGDDGRRSRDRPAVHIVHGETGTLKHGRLRIAFKDSPEVICQDTLKLQPRTSVIVCSESIKITGKLYGNNIEDKKWIVDGRNYMPESTIQKVLTFCDSQIVGRIVSACSIKRFQFLFNTANSIKSCIWGSSSEATQEQGGNVPSQPQSGQVNGTNES